MATLTNLRNTLRHAVPGAGMIAVTFGLARYGYGLLLPDMRSELGLDPGVGGLIASGGYLGYLAGNTAVIWLTARTGPRLPIALAASTAVVGMLLLAAAPDATVLASGVVVAGTSAGLAFPPYADVVAHRVAARHRSVAWSAISSGTGWGVALAGPLAVLCGTRWRLVWLVFAALAAVVGVVAVLAAPLGRIGAGLGGAHQPAPPRLRPSWLVCPRSGPLLVSSVLVGAGSAVWWAFSVDALRDAGLAGTPARLVYAVAGVAGVVASGTGLVTDRWGLRRGYLVTCVVLAGSVALLAVTGPSLVPAALAAGVFGAAYNGVVAVQGIWSAEVFAERPSTGQAAINTALTVGTIAGPSVAGAVIRWHGYPPALLGAAAVIALGALLAPPARPRPPAL